MKYCAIYYKALFLSKFYYASKIMIYFNGDLFIKLLKVIWFYYLTLQKMFSIIDILKMYIVILQFTLTKKPLSLYK